MLHNSRNTIYTCVHLKQWVNYEFWVLGGRLEYRMRCGCGRMIKLTYNTKRTLIKLKQTVIKLDTHNTNSNNNN